MVYDIDKSKLVKKLKEIGMNQMDQCDVVDKQLSKIVTSTDEDNSSPEVQYFKTIYDREELQALERKRN
ncbi:MAG: hypothetical protein WC136_00500 [Sphaerochaeta sp.]|jgi:hypothetical protein